MGCSVYLRPLEQKSLCTHTLKCVLDNLYLVGHVSVFSSVQHAHMLLAKLSEKSASLQRSYAPGFAEVTKSIVVPGSSHRPTIFIISVNLQ